MGSNHNHKPFRIATVATFDYFPFLLVFLSSLFKNVNIDRISSIEILVDTLPEDLRQYLEQFEKVRLNYTDSRHRFAGAHSDAWRCAVSEKLFFCQRLLAKCDDPLLLIDSDVMFVRDISIFENKLYSLIVTLVNNEHERHVRLDGINITFIAAAVYFSDALKSLEFIERWLRRMRKLESDGHYVPHETPALNLLLEECLREGRDDIGFVADDIIAADQKIKDETIAVHLKSWGRTLNTPRENFVLRSSKVAWPAELNPLNYLDALAYESWLVHQGYPHFVSGRGSEAE